jgi:geranylgeranyl diphosphate synthase, type I
MTTFAPAPQVNETVSAILTNSARTVESALSATVQRLSPALRPPVFHHLAGGGKGVRAALTLLSATAIGATQDSAVVGAVAIELVHNFSLIHDDVIDGDHQRHHRSTVWSEFGIGQAIIAGDALAALALQLLLEDPTPRRVQAARCLTDATSAMIAGQADDMAFESRTNVTVAECLAMMRGKTSALFSCAASLGAILGGAPDATVAALAAYGSHLGTAFQAVDDVLGIWGEPTRTGKPVGSDLVARKKSLPVAIALARSDEPSSELGRLLSGDMSAEDVERAGTVLTLCGAQEDTLALANTHLEEALAAIDRVLLVPRPKNDLVALARFVTDRDR